MSIKRRPAAQKAPVEQIAPPQIASPKRPLYEEMFEEAVNRHRAAETSVAEALYRAVIAVLPSHAEASYNLGLLCQTQGRLAEAVSLYREAILNRNDYVDAYSNLGTTFKELKLYDKAIAVYNMAIAIKPDFAMGYSNLGVALKDMSRHEEAIRVYRQAIALAPDYEWAYANLAPAQFKHGDPEQSIVTSRRAVTLKPNLPLALHNIGAASKNLNRLDDAVAAFREAIAWQADFGESHFALGQVLLMKGEFEEGWKEYDWRWSLNEYSWLKNIHGPFEQPLWDGGDDLAGKTILIYSEQGMGDAIQYARYLPHVLAKGAKIVLAVHPPLKPLFTGIDDVTVCGLDDVPLPPFDVHCPLLSLPRRFGTTFDTIPADIPYLRADPVKVDYWRKRMNGTGLRVGIVWAGNPTQRGDRLRSPRLSAVMPLFDVPGVQFISLQKGAGRDDMAANPLPARVLDLAEDIEDFADTAAIMAGLDLMITSCTAPLHLAGALGVPTWAIIPYAPHFLWQLDRTDSPWYPTLRLYRQETTGSDWSGTVNRVAADLAAMTR